MIPEVVPQVAIPAWGGVTAVLLARQLRAGYVVGLATQPFVFGTSLSHRQWGVLASTVVAGVAFALELRPGCRPTGRSESVADD
jgi:hypothetical protein